VRTLRSIQTITAAVVLTTLVAACSKSGSALSPGPVITTPSAQSPTNSQVVTSLTPTLTATASTADNNGAVTYRFQVVNSNDTLALDSGLVSSTSWVTSQTLTPNATYTWRVRGESGGAASAWSVSAAFKTGDPPPAYNKPIGNWEACASQVPNAPAVVNCVHAAVQPTNSPGGLEVVKRVAWLLRAQGAGLLIKEGGENVVLWQGYSFSSSRMCYSDGHIFKVIGAAGPGAGGNTPGYADDGFVDKSLFVPAIDPSKP